LFDNTSKERKSVVAETNTIDQVVGLIENMSVMELSELSKTLQDKFGVSAAAPMMMGAMPAGGGGAAAVEEEKTEFTPHLTQVGEKKIQVIKVIREITGLGLKEAKDLVDKAPSPVKENVSKEEAESIRAKLQEVGAVVEIK
jgi:large subunit ribosomal protein L7/L12